MAHRRACFQSTLLVPGQRGYLITTSTAGGLLGLNGLKTSLTGAAIFG